MTGPTTPPDDRGALSTLLHDGDATDVAPRLLGTLLLRTADDGVTRARIVEVEAYRRDDPASHTHRGPTRRNATMFGPAGRLYVYRSHGLHWCANVVVGPAGTGAAVLLRAAEVLDGHEVVRRRRAASRRDGAPPDDVLLSGPGNLGRGLALDGAVHDGLDLLADDAPLRLLPAPPGTRLAVRSGPRVGVSVAAERPWRWWVDGSPAVSPYRRSPRAPRQP